MCLEHIRTCTGILGSCSGITLPFREYKHRKVFPYYMFLGVKSINPNLGHSSLIHLVLIIVLLIHLVLIIA